MASENTFRNLNDLRVSDLREELEKRGLDKTGVKSVLVQRLKEALCEDSESFEANSTENSENSKETIMEKNLAEVAEVEEETTDVCPEDVDPSEMIVKDELDASIDDNEAADKNEVENDEKAVGNHYELKKLEVKVEDCASKIRPGPACSKVFQSVTVTKSRCASINVESKVDQSQTDQEDSINLTIGEDEEKLLQEADDVHQQSKQSDVKQQPKSTNNSVKQEQAGIKVERLSLKDENLEEQSADVSVSEECDENPSVTRAEKKNEDEASDTKSQQTEAASSSSSPSKSQTKEDKDSTKKTSSSSTSRNLWVSGLASNTRATDLKQVFSKYGKVIGAKVVTNARTPGARCYGYVTMASNEDATRCIHNLHRTELHGRMVSVERAKSDSAVPAKKDALKTDGEQGKGDNSDKLRKAQDNKSSDVANGADPSSENAVEKSEKASDGDKDKKAKSETKSLSKGKERSSSRKSRSKLSSKSRDRDRSPKGARRYKSDTSRERKMPVLSFNQIRAEREKQRMRDRERALREEERKRREELQRNREVERWQREEAARLAKEREKLQREREKIERERVEILKLERTRQKLERERLEFERMELKRQQMKIEEARMAAKRSALDRRDPYPTTHDDRKRPTLGERRMEAPPPPRFDQVSSGVGGSSQNRSGAGGNYGDTSDLMSKKRDYGGKREDIRKGDSRGAINDFKRGSEFDIMPRHSSGNSGHMMHPSHSSSHQGNLMKYSGQNYDDRGRDNSDLGSSRPESGSGGLLQSSRSKDSSRYADRSGDRPTDRGAGMPYRGTGDRDNGRRPVEAPDHRSSSGSKMTPRGGSRERRYVDSDSGRYNDRTNSSWHTGGGTSSSKPYGSGGMGSNTGSGLSSGQNMVSNNIWGGESRSKPSSQNQSSAWRQVDNSSSNDRWSRTPLYPPGVSPNLSMGNSNTYMDHRYNMPSMRKY